MGCEDVETARGNCCWGNLEERYKGNLNGMQVQEKFTYFQYKKIDSYLWTKRKEASWREVEPTAGWG